MNAVGKLGNYISRGVVTVSAPFHPFGGAVDIVVVEQRDGSFKSSPWYVQFGKFQGVLKAREKVVSINVNGVDADFCMYLDNRGGAHFVREVDGDEGISESISSSNDTDASSVIQMPRKITGCHYEFEPSNHKKKKMTRSNSTGHRVLGFVFGRRSWKEKRLQRDREASLERAEIAADLMEVRWSTSLAIRKHRKDNNLRGSECNGFHDKDDPELPLSTSPVNYMESFTLKETYLDFDVYESSVGSNGGDSGSNSNSGKSDVGGMSSGDEQSITFQALQGGDERRIEIVESSIYCDSSESFTDKLDGSSGESSENLCHVPAGLRGDKVNSELSSSILASEVDMNREDLEDKDPCISIDGSKSDSVTASDGETVLQTNVNVVVECKSNESHVKYVEEMAVNQIPSNEEPSLTNTYFTEEVTSTILDSRENMRSQKLSSPASTDLLHMGSCENNDSLLASMSESNRDAFMSSDSVREESNSQYFAESSEVKVGLLTKKPSETQFLFSDLDRSELTKTRDTQPIASDSLEEENDPQQYPKSSEEKLHEFTAMLNESHSFTGQETLPYDHSGSPKSASVKKKMVWAKTPTSEQLASLNLKEGRNEVTFTFSNPMLGEQKVDARIYLWKWNARIVISDVDGTITKSDVLGQFMPLVGVDWSQTGVAHLFSAIKENGYELLFLSARAISQASLTRNFLFNLKQDGKALPEGPVVISPDGLFPSLIREVIRRAPHEFKIACLEAIRALFPPDHNPFYAGFGNRDTDELSYLKVGIPKGKIFIINPRGEVAVQRRVDRKSYTSLYTLVHDMYPPPSSVSSSEQEDFNSWNFWRLPPPEIVV